MSLRFHALGIDLSLNHAGFVQLDELCNVKWTYVTNTKSKAIGLNARLIDIPKSGDKQLDDMRRLAWWRDELSSLLRSDFAGEFVGVEDYAFAAPGHAHATGELGGIARLEVLRSGAALRLHDPMSVKLFATGKGNADAQEVVRGVEASWGVNFTAAVTRGEKVNTLACEDLAAAYTIARMVHTEVLLREGAITMASLPAHQIRVFNRCTKSNPLNLLAREFIYLRRDAA